MVWTIEKSIKIKICGSPSITIQQQFSNQSRTLSLFRVCKKNNFGKKHILKQHFSSFKNRFFLLNIFGKQDKNRSQSYMLKTISHSSPICYQRLVQSRSIFQS